MKKGDLLAIIQGVDFFYYGYSLEENCLIVYTEKQKHYIPRNTISISRECERIYANCY